MSKRGSASIGTNDYRPMRRRKVTWGKHWGELFGKVGIEYLLRFAGNAYGQMTGRLKRCTQELCYRRLVSYGYSEEDADLIVTKFDRVGQMRGDSCVMCSAVVKRGGRKLYGKCICDRCLHELFKAGTSMKEKSFEEAMG